MSSSPTSLPGTLLDGRVRYSQYADGYRTGIEPVLLAALVAARDGERVIEAGCGAGAGLLCLAARLPGVSGTGVEIDPALAALARRNAAENGWEERIEIVAGTIEAFEATGTFDHAMANPPWHDPRGTTSPVTGRRTAKRADAGLLDGWIGAMAAVLRPRGTVNLVIATRQMDAALAALAAHGCGSIDVMPLWPRVGREARMLLVRGVRGGRAATRLLPGLVLHDGAGYSAAAEAVLRGGDALRD